MLKNLILIGFRITLILGLINFKCVYANENPSNAFNTKPTSTKTTSLETKTGSIHYAYAGDTAKPGVIFIHGTPGKWQAFSSYLNHRSLREKFFLVSVDRPGWGLSNNTNAKVTPSFEIQANSIISVMQQYPNKKWIIVGHSLGASLAPKITYQAPELVSHLLILAGSINPKLGKPRWYNHVANNMLLKWFVPKKLRISNKEIMLLRNELEVLNQQISTSKLNTNLVVIQGMKDKLVSPKNPAFISKEWNSNFVNIEIIELEDEGHFLPWRQTDLIIEKLQSMYVK